MTHAKKHSNGTKLTYDRISRALRSLGYERLEAKGSHIVFTHPKTRVDLILPLMKPDRPIDPTRLAGVYQLVAAGGIASHEELDAAIAEAK
jgi:predicted RNA binding protein YcfA (HicA-like mRNA interferase family)